MKIKFKSEVIYSIIVCMGILIYIFLAFPRKYNYVHVNSLENNLGNLTNKTVVEQSFVAKDDNLSSIGIIFGKYMNDSDSNVTVTLNENGNEVFKKNINAKKINESKFSYIKFEPIENSKGRTYSVKINVNGNNEERDITIYSSRDNIYEYGSLYVNGIESESDISFATEYSMNLKLAITKTIQEINGSSGVVIVMSILIITFVNILSYIKNVFWSN